MGQTTSLLMTDMYVVELSHFPFPSKFGKLDLGRKGTAAAGAGRGTGVLHPTK